MATESDAEQPAEQPQQPVLRVIKGDATPEEVAAIVAVVAAMQAPEEPPRRRRPAWSDPARGVRRSHAHGPSGWRSSGLPR